MACEWQLAGVPVSYNLLALLCADQGGPKPKQSKHFQTEKMASSRKEDKLQLSF